MCFARLQLIITGKEAVKQE